ncbi:MAG: hypothetical protein HWD61_04580 [Parachlamydiaceae bacterium]|nr:MAG: hypothetical protein HWD61_04580 [Parachlamydiaceae bacterium]
MSHASLMIDLSVAKIYQPGQIPPRLSSFDSLPGAQTFWGLGKDFWKQIIESRWHSCNLVNEEKYGNVFRAIESGCIFATEHLGKN